MQQTGALLDGLVQPGNLFIQPGQFAFVHLTDVLRQLQHPGAAPDAALVCQQLGQLRRFGQGRLPFLRFGQAQARQILAQGIHLLFRLGPAGGGHLLQPRLQRVAPLGGEHLPQNGAAIPAGFVQQLGKLVLGDHGNLAELVHLNAQQLLHRRVHLFLALGHRDGDFALQAFQQRVRRDLPGALAPLFAPGLGGAAPDAPYLPPVREGELSAGFQRVVRIVAADHLLAAHPAGELAEQGIAHPVKQGGLARAGVAGNQKQPACTGGFKIHRLTARVGAEGGQSQGHWSHASTSRQTGSSTACSSSLSGRPCTD